MSINRVVLVGNLTRDPELRTLPSGSTVLSIRIGVNSRRKVNEEWTDVPNYFSVTVFGKRGEAVSRFLSKGSRIGVDGRLSWREWESDGAKREAVEVIADDIQLLDGKPASDRPAAAAAPSEDPWG